MMQHSENHIICGGLPVPKKLKGSTVLALNLHGKLGDDDHVNLRIEHFHIPFGRTLAPRFIDLVEIASYVYAADQATIRQYQDTDRFGMDWRQRLHFRIPVRDLEFWNRPDVGKALVDVLNFLGDHFFSFEFSKAKKPVPFQDYLTSAEAPTILSSYDEIAMFSGGLDSLAGAVEALRRHHRRMVFVTHLPTTKNNRLITDLRAELQALVPNEPPLHVAIEVNKSKDLGKEPTQRVRSFLFACLGATTAHAIGLNRLTFFENGVISLNLPLCGQVVGGRATRTTHPRVLAGFSHLFSLAFEQPFEVSNPYLEKTKADVVRVLVDQGAAQLIGKSISCAHTWERRADQTHCGHCSQCLDRRLAMLSASAFDHDPSSIYRTNIFTDSLPAETDRILVSTYIERARTMKQISTPEEFIIRYPEALDAVEFVPGANPDRAVRLLFDLYKRHSMEIDQAVKSMRIRYSDDIHEHRLPGDCLVRIATDSSGTVPSPVAETRVLDEPDCLFRRFDEVWEFRFLGGRKFIIKDNDTGCSYLHYLLSNPGESFSSSQLDRAAKPPVATQRDEEILGTNPLQTELSVVEELDHGGTAIDERTKAEVVSKIRDLRVARVDAERANNSVELAEIDEELSGYEHYLNGSVTKSGASRKIQDPAKRMNDSVRAAFNRLLGVIGGKDARFHTHLTDRDCLIFGSDNAYRPPAGIAWVTA